MNTIIAPSDVVVMLAPLKETTTIKDPNGKVIGTYTPAPPTEPIDYERIKNLFDLEAAERDLAAGGPTLSTEEVRASLKALGPSR